MVRPIQFKKTALATALLTLGASSASFAADGKLDEILVTTQFVEQNVQQTPVAVTAITSEGLVARGLQTVDNISAQSPNVTLTQGGGYSGPSLIGFIRGVGQTDFNPALEPGVGLYVDDVYYSQLSGSILELLDLDRVEVLRGPQGTLAGKNSIGGAIKLYTRRPNDDANGYLEAGLGSFDTVSVRGASNFTLVKDTLYGRLSGVSRSQEGYVTRLDYNCANPGNQIDGLDSAIIDGSCKTGEDGGSDYTGVRFALRWLPSDDLEVNLSTEKVRNKLGAPPSVLVGTYADPDPNAPNRQAWNDYRERFVPDKGEYITYGTYVDSRSNLTIPDEMHVNSSGTTLNVDWRLSDSLQLQSITGIREFETAFGTDLDQSPIPILQQYQVLTHEQTSQEFRLNGDVGKFMEYTVGAFWFDAHTELSARVDLGYSSVELDFVHGPDPVDVTNSAVFANTIMHPTDTIDVTLGVRHSTDEKIYAYHRRNPDLSAVEACTGAPGTPGVPSNCVLNGLDGLSETFEDSRTDYRLAASWRATDNAMLYYQYATGFKGGGVNPRPFFTPQAAAFDPEELTTHEIGAKWQLMDDRMRINAAYFINDYQGVQLTLLDCTAYFPDAGVPCLAPKNSGDADVSGFELEVDYQPFEQWLIEASLSTLDFEYTEIDPNTGLTGDEVTPFTPELTWSFSTQYDFYTPIGMISPRIDASYQDEVQTAANISTYGQIEDRTLINASINLLSTSEEWLIRFGVTNLTDEFYYTNITDNASSRHAYALVGMPRTWNLSLKRMF